MSAPGGGRGPGDLDTVQGARWPPLARRIVWVDGLSGLCAGAFVLALHGWLARLHGLPVALVAFLGAVNLAYGAYSASLAARASYGRPPARRWVTGLCAANAGWALVCVALCVAHRGRLTAFGAAHLLFEAAYVLTLAALEWRHVRPAARG